MSPRREWTGRKLTTAELRRRTEAIWSTGSYSQAAEKVDLSQNGLSATAYRLGFTRSMSGKGEILRGPCIRCLAPHDIGTLDADRVCPRCLRGDSADEDLAHGKTLAEERAASRKRMREREQGKRESLGQPRTPITYVMRNARVQ